MSIRNQVIACLVALVVIGSFITPAAFAAEITDESVLALIDQLEAIDTLQKMQDTRSKYAASGHYDINTTDQTVIARHDAARMGYEAYVDTMFAARIAAQNAYDALTPEQKSQIDPSLVAKLNDELPTVFNKATLPVTPGDDEYTFEAVDGGLGYGYEVSNHMVSGNIPQTFVLVDTSDEQKAGSVTTDVTGYASLSLDQGLYLVIEQHNPNKVKAPVRPFFVSVPMPVENSGGGDTDTEVVAEYLDIVSIYPKNEPIEPSDNPTDIPPSPDNVSGRFSIVKHDAYHPSQKLSGASFQVFRAAVDDDANTQIISCGGIKYVVVPVTADGEPLILTTDENGTAQSPELICGTYFLIETKAPNGYSISTAAIPVIVKSKLVSDAEVLYIANSPGNILPATGGTGTTLMIWIGSVTAIVAAVLLVTKKKMSIYE